MERTKLKSVWWISNFMLKHKIISVILALFLVVMLSRVVAFGSSESGAQEDQNKSQPKIENIDSDSAQQANITTDSVDNVVASAEVSTLSSIDGANLIPIQQGTSTKVNFLPAYNGDTPPCNFYKKDSNGKFTQISGITNMKSLGIAIKNAGAENVYTDGNGQTFYGCYDTTWSHAFEDHRYLTNGHYWENFNPDFCSELQSKNLPTTNVYGGFRQDETTNCCNWYGDDEKLSPSLGNVNFNLFWDAYKSNDLNLLTINSWRVWSSFLRSGSFCGKYANEYININNESKWRSNYNINEDVGVVVLTQKMQSHSVKFDTQGHGGFVADQRVVNGHVITEPQALIEPGYDFVGWYKDLNLSNKWSCDNDVITCDTTLYAKWHKTGSYDEKFVPIQQGIKSKVNYLPVYRGNTPPCNFYKKESETTYSLIPGITSMGSLGAAIKNAGPENVYTDGWGQTFYGCFDATWTDAFSDRVSGCDGEWDDRGKHTPEDDDVKYYRNDLAPSFKQKLINNGLQPTNIYNQSNINIGFTDLGYYEVGYKTPTLNNIDIHTFWYAYKNKDVNLLTPNSWRIWTLNYTFGHNESVWEYIDKNNEMKWHTNTNYDKDVGAVILTNTMSTCTAQFDTQGKGNQVANRQVPQYNLITEPASPACQEYDFEGWYKEPSCINKWSFNRDTIKSNITLYAKWIPKVDTSKLVPIQQGTTYKVNFLPAYNGYILPCNFYKKEADGSYTPISNISDMASLATKIRDIGAEKVYVEPKGIIFYGFYDNTTWSNAFKHESDGNKHHRYEFLDSFKNELANHGLPTTSVYTERVGSDYVNPGNWDYHNAYTPTLNGVSIHSFWYAYKNTNVKLLGTNSWRIWTSYEDTWASDDAMEYWDSEGKMEWHANKGFENDKGSVILTKVF